MSSWVTFLKTHRGRHPNQTHRVAQKQASAQWHGSILNHKTRFWLVQDPTWAHQLLMQSDRYLDNLFRPGTFRDILLSDPTSPSQARARYQHLVAQSIQKWSRAEMQALKHTLHTTTEFPPDVYIIKTTGQELWPLQQINGYTRSQNIIVICNTQSLAETLVHELGHIWFKNHPTERAEWLLKHGYHPTETTLRFLSRQPGYIPNPDEISLEAQNDVLPILWSPDLTSSPVSAIKISHPGLVLNNPKAVEQPDEVFASSFQLA
jgi:hypothetical protein